MTTPEDRYIIGEVIREDAANRSSQVTVISCKVDESCGQNLERKNAQLRQQLADVLHDRDLLRSLLKRVIDSSVLAFEQDGPEEFESLEADICAAIKPSAEVLS